MTSKFDRAKLAGVGFGEGRRAVLDLRADDAPDSRPLRLALFSGNYNYTADGANRALNRLVGHLQRREGVQVRVYSPTTSTPAFPPQGDLVSTPAVRVPLRPDYRLAIGLTPGLIQDVTRFAPDIVHLSAPDPLGFSAQRLARRLGVPVVASVHTLFDSYLAYYRLEWLRPLVEARLAAFYQGADYVLAPTDALAARFAAEGLGARARVWSRGVDRSLFSPARRSLDWRRAQGFGDDQTVVVYFGRIVLEKGLTVFAETITRLKRMRPDVGVLVVGDGPERAWFEEQLPGAAFTGHLAGEALARAVASGDVLLNPSVTETFCNVTLEAMASGLAVVCSDAPNHRNLIRSPEVGRLCAPSDAQAYAEALSALAGDAALRERLAAAAAAEAARFDWDEILSGVAAIYREALGLVTGEPRRERACA